jgi:5-methylcytosine-specific restriction endonuclease McrA
MRAWKVANPKAAAAADARQDKKRRALNALHPEISKAREAARYAADPERHRARRIAYHAANREKENAAGVAYRRAHPELSNASSRRWEAKHPELKAQYQATRYARRHGNGGSHTLAEWRTTCALFNNCCAYCGKAKPLSRDHDIPLSRGGRDDITNIIPACRSCNSSKRTRTMTEFLAVAP